MTATAIKNSFANWADNSYMPKGLSRRTALGLETPPAGVAARTAVPYSFANQYNNSYGAYNNYYNNWWGQASTHAPVAASAYSRSGVAASSWATPAYGHYGTVAGTHGAAYSRYNAYAPSLASAYPHYSGFWGGSVAAPAAPVAAAYPASVPTVHGWGASTMPATFDATNAASMTGSVVGGFPVTGSIAPSVTPSSYAGGSGVFGSGAMATSGVFGAPMGMGTMGTYGTMGAMGGMYNAMPGTFGGAPMGTFGGMGMGAGSVVGGGAGSMQQSQDAQSAAGQSHTEQSQVQV